MVVSLVLGAAVLIGAGLYSSSLIASIASPLALILAAFGSITVFTEMMDQKLLKQFFSSENGWFIGLGLVSAAVFYLVFVVGQALITQLSPLAGIIVIGVGVALFFAGPTEFIDLLKSLSEVFDGQ